VPERSVTIISQKHQSRAVKSSAEAKTKGLDMKTTIPLLACSRTRYFAEYLENLYLVSEERVA
jgi:hypothetical protein